MELSLLPDEALAHIMQFLDWHTLQNARLVSRKFFDVIESNNRHMQKPKVSVMHISSTNEENIGEQVRAVFVIKDNKITTSSNVSIQKRPKVISLNIIELKYLLRRMDLFLIDQLYINIRGNSEIFDILNMYITSKTVVNDLCIDIMNSPVFNSFMKFFTNLKRIHQIYFHNLCFGSQDIPTDISLPKIPMLKRFCISESKCTKFINSRMIGNLFINFPNINEVLFHSERCDFNLEIVNTIQRRQKYDERGACFHKNISLISFFTPNPDPIQEYDKYFKNNINYLLESYYGFPQNEISFLVASSLCSHCNKKDLISFAFIAKYRSACRDCTYHVNSMEVD
uniref:F-box domain-containing protein n=1 Tax=Parastrongyloides trichosuri TaxID=131310 RepID=A0A0N4Z1Q6_PARTI